MCVIIERRFQAQRHNNADGGDVRGEREVGVRLFRFVAVACGGGAHIPAHIFIGVAVGHVLRRGHIGRYRFVGAAVVVIISVEAYRRLQERNFAEIHNPFHPAPYEGRAVGEYPISLEGAPFFIREDFGRTCPCAVGHGHDAGYPVDAVLPVRRRDGALLEGCLSGEFKSERRVFVNIPVGVNGLMMEERERHEHRPYLRFQPHLPLPAVLPAEVGVITRDARRDVIGQERRAVGHRAGRKGQLVGIVGARIEHLERREFYGLSPAGGEREPSEPGGRPLHRRVARAEARRQAAHRAIARSLHQRDVGAQAGDYLQAGDAYRQLHVVFDIPRQVVHKRRFVEPVRTPAGRGIAQVVIINTASEVTGGSEIHACQHIVPYASEVPRPVPFQVSREVERLAVGQFRLIPVAGRDKRYRRVGVFVEARSHEIALLQPMHGGNGR